MNIRDNKTTLGGKTLAPHAPIIRKQLKRNRQSAFAQQQALRLGLLAGQALEQSDNPAKICRKRQPQRVGLKKGPFIGA